MLKTTPVTDLQFGRLCFLSYLSNLKVYTIDAKRIPFWHHKMSNTDCWSVYVLPFWHCCAISTLLLEDITVSFLMYQGGLGNGI